MKRSHGVVDRAARRRSWDARHRWRQAQAPQKVVFALNWFAVGDHAAYWVALDKGYYKAKGLDVELQNSKGSGDSIAKVDTNRADIGLADAVVVIPRVAQGAKIKIVGAVFDLTPLNIWTRKDTGHHEAEGPRGQDARGAARRQRSASSSRPSRRSTASTRAR